MKVSFEKVVKSVMGKVPDGSSPISCLAPYVCVAPQMLAPEKADLLAPHMREISFEWKAGRWIFSTSSTRVRISVGALNLLWCASYASWFVYAAYGDAQKKRLSDVQLGNDPEAGRALSLYEWAINGVGQETAQDWPQASPKPTVLPLGSTDPINIANEIFLTAVGWILLHEIGHIALQHPFVTIADRSITEEHQADRFATDHVLGGLLDLSLIQKRALGIAVANVVLVLLDLMSGQAKGGTHPSSEERLNRNLSAPELDGADPIHAFATAFLQVHLEKFRVPYDLEEHENFSLFVDDFCFSLNRSRP